MRQPLLPPRRRQLGTSSVTIGSLVLADARSKSARILIVDDDVEILSLLSRWLGEEGYEVKTATSASEALTQVGVLRPQLVITDLFMEGMDGMDLLTEIHRERPLLPVIMLSGRAQIPDAVRATHLGSAAFLTKPVERERLLDQVQRVTLAGADPRIDAVFARGLIHRSAAMTELVELAKQVAQSDVTVLISGATGTGKEVLARAIHDAGPRREQPFVPVNCGAIPEQLLESELFGHEKGAFTGAVIRHEGLFRAANGGTVFLDEIGDMPLALQVKLLRVLQDLEVRPVGSTRTFPINVRVISATHRDLGQSVQAGEFREDLYYRLNVVPLQMPALAERREDIAPLVEHFLEKQRNRPGVTGRRFAPEAMEYLIAAPWPGNIRQLSNVVDLCVTLSKTETIPLSLVKRALRDVAGGIQTLKEAKHQFERNYLISVLRITEGHVANAARIAGRNRTEFYKLLNQHGIDPVEFRGPDKGGA
jgi:two-component system response regulator GlrR